MLCLSDILNKIHGFNSFATLHDQWMNSLELNTGREMMFFENIGSMTPALLINYGSLYERYNYGAEKAKYFNETSFSN